MSPIEASDSYLHTDKIIKLIREDGLLTRCFKGFEPRLQQQKMMSHIIDAYNQDQIALIEAGTGTGKSIAYLLPALIWAAKRQEKTVISTNTITLQEQLVNKDIPTLIEALNLKLKAVLVKGMNNYVCLRKLDDAQIESRLFPSEDNEEIQKIAAWCQQATEGSRSELPFLPSFNAWERVGAESDACSHQNCPYYQQCYFFKARRQANDAHILVVNHHLLFADLVRRGESDNYTSTSILPAYKRVILDEAHHIEDIATEYFASRLHRLELMRVLGRLSSDRQNKANGKLPMLKEKLQLLFQKAPPRDITAIINRLTLELPALRRQLNEKIHDAFETFVVFLEHLRQHLVSNPDEQTQSEHKLRILKEHYQHPKWQETIVPHTRELLHVLKQYSHGLNSMELDLSAIDNDRLHEQTKSIRFDIQALRMRLESSICQMNDFISDLVDENKVRWVEAQKLKVLTNIHLVDAALDVSKALVNFLFSKFSTIILCSATLTTNQCFSFIRHRLGLTSTLLPQRTVTEHSYDSPFDYQKQALLVVPTDMPHPAHLDFNQAAYHNIWLAIQASHGNAFILFTSYTMLQKCYEALADKLKTHRYTRRG
jgi:ATP-dependent DNA helicase DinG